MGTGAGVGEGCPSSAGDTAKSDVSSSVTPEGSTSCDELGEEGDGPSDRPSTSSSEASKVSRANAYNELAFWAATRGRDRVPEALEGGVLLGVGDGRGLSRSLARETARCVAVANFRDGAECLEPADFGRTGDGVVRAADFGPRGDNKRGLCDPDKSSTGTADAEGELAEPAPAVDTGAEEGELEPSEMDAVAADIAETAKSVVGEEDSWVPKSAVLFRLTTALREELGAADAPAETGGRCVEGRVAGVKWSRRYRLSRTRRGSSEGTSRSSELSSSS
ncbi:hypothetical protein ON010_g13396 [Phytophthora cinnamomi]|nr:hypothetical protein ON010_g13396 [Phytophthora cinnamomi]